jgi:hypothetical protein
MSRKKSRQANRAPAAKPPASAATLTSAPPAPPAASVPATAVAAPQTAVRITKPAADVSAAPRPAVQRAWIELVGIRLARLLGSLQLAVILLSLFALTVFLGTLMEHWYTTKIAQTLVYKAWWFVFLLALLALNIFFAAIKKGDFTKLHWPWKKHQSGFLITHVGLLTMLAGGMWHWAAGTDAAMQLIDTQDPAVLNAYYKETGYMPQQASSTAVYSDAMRITVQEEDPHEHANPHRRPSQQLKPREADFEPGPLPWKSENIRVGKDSLLSFLTWLQSPLGRSWSLGLANGARLEVLDYLPYAQREPFSPVEKGGFPALKFRLASANAGALEDWAGANVSPHGAPDLFGKGMPLVVEMLGTCPTALLGEFLNPPAPDQLGQKGVLAVVLPGAPAPVRIPVDQALAQPGQKFDLPGTGVQLQVTGYFPNWEKRRKAAADEPAADPAVEVELLEGGKVVAKLQIQARLAGLFFDVQRGGLAAQQDRAGLPLFWYHAADPRGGLPSVAGVIHFVQTPGQQLYYRSFSRKGEAFALEKRGPLEASAEVPVLDRMQWTLRLVEHLPQATDEPRYTPAPVAPGKPPRGADRLYTPAVLCRLSAGGEHTDFWLGQGQRRPFVGVGKRYFTVAFTTKLKDLGFEIKLERAEQTVDPGTRAPASYSSYVQVFDPERGVNGDRFQITMNEPLEHGGYKFYQSEYVFLDRWDSSNKPVSTSGFTVGHDPGLRLKYLGSLMLGLGVFCMFYMKAYFFKPRGRAAAAAPENPKQPAQEG